MEAGELLLLFASWTLVTFTLGAVVAHRLEGRRPLAEPRWLVLLGVLTSDVMAVTVVVITDRPTGVIAIDPFWWTALDVGILVSAAVTTIIRLRALPRERSRDEAA